MKPHFYLTIALLAQVNLCYPQWIQTDGPYGSTNVSAIIGHDSLLLTATNCGYFSKNQLADRWTFNSTFNFSCYTKKGDSLFAGSMYGGIQLIDLNNPDNPPVTINPIPAKTLANSDSCLYLGNETQGFLKSANYGSTWNSYNTGLPTDTLWNPWIGTYYQTNVTAIEVLNNYIFCGTKKGVYRNSTNLSNWTGVNSGLSLSVVTFVKAFNDTLYTAISNSLFRSADYGNSWNLVYTAPSNISTILAYNFGMYIGTTGDGVYYSSDNCVHWSSLNMGLTDLKINVLANYDSTLLCGTNAAGFFYFQSSQWHKNEQGMICSSIRSMAVTNNNVISNDESKVYKLNLNGNWIDISPVVTYELFGSLASMHDTIFLSVEHDTPSWPYDNPFIVFSSDNGITWNNLFTPVPFARDDPYRIYSENGRLYAYEDEKMCHTDNLGISWTDISLPSQYCNMFNDFIINNAIPYAAACGNGQLVMLDNTQNWVLSNNGLPADREPIALANCDSALFAYISVHGMYVSFDNGNSWTYANNGLVTNYSIRDFASRGTDLFVTTDFGVFATNDFGQHWAAINDGLKNLNVSSIKFLNDTLYVGTYGNGIWKLSIADIHLNIQEYQQSNNSLMIYPNPASDYIHVSANSKKANFKIIDMLGKEILSGKVNSGGEINISEVRCGLYTIFVQLDKEVQTTKLIINR
ncbi:MAG TPA: T9SS type A sorting domain-containing protein [Bacteroidales bacterium]|nr:T9SS type A sorting domain-containing protein [Bacteroidales bacterium]